MQSAPKRWPPRQIAFYQPKAFAPEAFQIRLYGRISEIRVCLRRELFPNEPENANSDKRYYRLAVEDLQERPEPILSRFPRRVVFVPTTLEKFMRARELNDLFDESPLEDALWDALTNAEFQRSDSLICRFRSSSIGLILPCSATRATSIQKQTATPTTPNATHPEGQ